ncbi:sulfurtransferase TusA family protein [Microlunatus sp. Y2014]|uniref:sulfurtransferase TusA family protein n=1 Tax=Microlunatus sp. Y2014 TaxID=3418488 RepID=UPI003DA72D86
MSHTHLSPLPCSPRRTALPQRPLPGSVRRHVLDTTGQVSPFPLVAAKRTLALLPAGDELMIFVDCSQATLAITEWAHETGHLVTRIDEYALGSAITVRRG